MSGQTLYLELTAFRRDFGDLSVRLSDNPTFLGSLAGDDFSDEMEEEGQIIFVAADGQSVTVEGIGDSSEPYSWRPSNNSEVAPSRIML